MPRQYPADQKAAALVLLERNHGNIPLTAQQIGVSENTLYVWRRSIQPFLLQNHPPLSQPAEVPAFNDDLEALAFVRRQIIDEMLRLSVALSHDPGLSTPYQRVLVLSQLMDRLMKLDAHLRPYEPPQKIIIEGSEDEEPNGDGWYDDDDEYMA